MASIGMTVPGVEYAKYYRAVPGEASTAKPQHGETPGEGQFAEQAERETKERRMGYGSDAQRLLIQAKSKPGMADRTSHFESENRSFRQGGDSQPAEPPGPWPQLVNRKFQASAPFTCLSLGYQNEQFPPHWPGCWLELYSKFLCPGVGLR